MLLIRISRLIANLILNLLILLIFHYKKPNIPPIKYKILNWNACFKFIDLFLSILMNEVSIDQNLLLIDLPIFKSLHLFKIFMILVTYNKTIPPIHFHSKINIYNRFLLHCLNIYAKSLIINYSMKN